MAVSSKATIFLVLIGVGSGLLLNGCKASSSAPAPAVPEVSVVTLQPERVVLTTELPGRTSPYSIAEIRPQVGGIIQKRLFEEGAEIRADQVLYQIDPAQFQAAVDNAAASLAAAQKAVDRARANLDVSRASVARQRATLDNAKLTRKRYEDLLADGAISASQRDQAVTDADVAEATLRSAEAQVESDRESIATAEAAVRQAVAMLDAARINLAYARVTAPITGRIGRSNVTIGALVTANQATPLATIQQLDPIYVDVTQSSATLIQLRRNIAAGRIQGDGPDRTRVKLLLEDGSPYPIEGTLKFSEVTVDPSTGSFVVRLVFPNPQRHLLPGMFVRGQLVEGIVEQAILVPQQGVSRDPKGNPSVLLVGAEDKVEQRAITVDRTLGDRWLVSAGLAAGDRVIVEGMQKVRPGTAVKIVPFAGKQTPEAAKTSKSTTPQK
ncbi:MAG TPA: efflux RND transporter periplasmic adaptor subunit [Candidatus Baltobacteraceae bacterium]|nr:efflux RND transporter periplasmic adaptor subunit [Candidatus Baltobacteraceae bacterium]